MPLLDHFHPPLFPRRHWDSFHSGWASTIAEFLNQGLLPEGYYAEEHTHLGARIEIDVATFADGASAADPSSWRPPPADVTIPGAFPDTFDVLVFEAEGGARLVAAIELVSPANKDRGTHRQAFAVKCASYLVQGISLVLVDIVTSRMANLHDEMMELLRQPAARREFPGGLYAAAYRPIVRGGREEIDVWTATLAVGQPLPTLPLALNAVHCLPIDLEATYTTNCQRRRLPA